MPTTIRGEEYLTTEEAAKYLDVSVTTLDKWKKKYELPSRRFEGRGNKQFIKKSDLDKLKDNLDI